MSRNILSASSMIAPSWIVIFSSVLLMILYANKGESDVVKLYHFAVATEKTDGYERFLRSTENFQIPDLRVIGLDSGIGYVDMNGPNGGFKLRLIYDALVDLQEEVKKEKKLGSCSAEKSSYYGVLVDRKEPYQDNIHSQVDPSDALVIVTDAYDVIYSGSTDDIKNRFLEMKVDVLFGAEVFCWPNKTLKNEYPTSETPYRYLNSGGFIGKLSVLLEILSPVKDSNDSFDDQLFLTNVFLQSFTNPKYHLALDYKTRIFQNLAGAKSHVFLTNHVDPSQYWLYNNVTENYPMVIHGNGPSKNFFNWYVGNYLAPFNPADIISTNYDNYPKMDQLPVIEVALFIEKPIPFLGVFFQYLRLLKYPKEKWALQIYSLDNFQNRVIEENLDALRTNYSSVEWKSLDEVCEETNGAICDFDMVKADVMMQVDEYNKLLRRGPEGEEFDEKSQSSLMMASEKALLLLDPTIHITNPLTLIQLVDTEIGIIAPIISHEFTMWSTFWGDISEQGYYERSEDYYDLARGQTVGIFNSPYVYGMVLIRSSKLPAVLESMSRTTDIITRTGVQISGVDDWAMIFAYSLRERGIHMYAINLDHYGALVIPGDYEGLEDEHFELKFFHNAPHAWTRKYLDIESYQQLYDKTSWKDFEQPCPDVYRMKIFNELFAKELIELAEKANKWSPGGHSAINDDRFDEKYEESYPTVDVHLYQLGFNETWIDIVTHLINPFLLKIFPAFNFELRDRRNFMFVVRYRPEEQAFLRPHHDHSTFTLSLALNTPGKDFEGGGCRFIRHDCSVLDSMPGQIIVHPGRLTHMHEGLETTKGTRYIMISFMQQ